MDWVWKRLAGYVQAKIQVELNGISEEALLTVLRQESIRRLEYVEAVVFSEEIAENEKISILKEWFLTENT